MPYSKQITLLTTTIKHLQLLTRFIMSCLVSNTAGLLELHNQVAVLHIRAVVYLHSCCTSHNRQLATVNAVVPCYASPTNCLFGHYLQPLYTYCCLCWVAGVFDLGALGDAEEVEPKDALTSGRGHSISASRGRLASLVKEWPARGRSATPGKGRSASKDKGGRCLLAKSG